MIIYFSIYSFLGYLMESLYVSALERKWISSGLLKGPYIPLYGFGAIILIYLKQYLPSNIIIVSIFGGICMTLLEYITSIYIEKIFHTHCWDYSHHHFHLHGRICLYYTILWCILSGLFIKVIHPFIIQLNLMNDLTTILSLIYLSFMFKAFINKLKFSKKNGLDLH